MLTKGIGRFSKVLEASEILAAVIDLAMEFRVLQVLEIEASSVGSSQGRIKSAHLNIGVFAFSRQIFSFIDVPVHTLQGLEEIVKFLHIPRLLAIVRELKESLQRKKHFSY